jgi:serine/threonine protein kinase
MALTRSLATRFEFVNRLGSGGLGELVRVRDKITRETLALRTTIFDGVDTIVDALRGVVELHTTLVADGLPIVRVVDAGRDDDAAWYAMEFADGESVLASVRRQGRMPPAQALAVIREVTECVASLHQRNVIHQDLSPRNVFVEGGTTRVLEVGVAAALARAIKARPAALASPRAKAPEQLVADAEPRTDLYAIGCLFYYSLTGRKAIADGAANLRLATRGGMRTPNLDRVAPELRPILARTLAMRPDDRFASAAELLGALNAAGTVQ